MTTSLEAPDAVHALFDRLIDDASLFPPASLSMKQALRAHARNRESAYRSMQGKFVVPFSRLDELHAARDTAVPLSLSVIYDGSSTDLRAGVERDLGAIAAARNGDNLTIDSIEVKLTATYEPATFALAAAALGEAWSDATVAVWLEMPYDGGWRLSPEITFAAIAQTRAAAPPNVAIGVKLRCGGTNAEAIPSIRDVTAFLLAVQRAGIPWRATAGLHHPFRHRSAQFGVPMHGFVNLFVAGIALHAGALDEGRLPDVLAEHDARAFAIDPRHMAWRDVSIETEAIAAARAFAVSYGSCSFSEPVNDLRELGIVS